MRVPSRVIRAAALAFVVLLLVAASGFVIWATSTPDPGPSAIAALESDEAVQVVDGDGFTFLPATAPSVGFILYPGARVDPASYAAPARAIAEAGYLVVVPKLTLNLAVFDSDAADEIIAAHPEIDRWVMGGHSLGGAMAAEYTDERRDSVAGLVLWAAFPGDGTDLSTLDAPVVSVYGTRDGLATVDDIAESRRRLPDDAVFVPVDGGNHAQFGDYGEQSGDNPATVTRDEQQAEVVEASLRVLDALG